MPRNKYLKIYREYFSYGDQDIVLSEIGSDEDGEIIAADIHHITPRSQGGSDEIENLIALTRRQHNQAHNIKKPYICKEYLQKIHNIYLKK